MQAVALPQTTICPSGRCRPRTFDETIGIDQALTIPILWEHDRIARVALATPVQPRPFLRQRLARKAVQQGGDEVGHVGVDGAIRRDRRLLQFRRIDVDDDLRAARANVW